jgi:predicted nuclease of restriction endonuclease-like (RecB) superfamily
MSQRARKSAPAKSGLPADYGALLVDLKSRVRTAQVKAALAVNAELVLLYWQMGHRIAQQQAKEGWGAGVIPRLATDLHAEFPELRGFSERNLKRMIAFYREYPDVFPIVPPAVAKLSGTAFVQQPAALLPDAAELLTEGAIVPTPSAQLADAGILPPAVAKLTPGAPIPILPQLAAKLPWFHHVLLMEKVKVLATRIWYMQRAIEHGWSYAVLTVQIETQAHRRTGKAVTNFAQTLPPPQSDLAQQVLKDPYTFDFLTLSAEARERELEQGLTEHIQKFLVELGVGFAFVGRQVHLEVGGEDYYLDLLFYHLKLRCFVVLDLKMEAFKPEFAGKMNFYLTAVDEQMRHAEDRPTIGLLLCKEKNRLTVEYALRDVKKPIGVAEWKTRLVESLPKQLRGALPSVEDLEKGLAGDNP